MDKTQLPEWLLGIVFRGFEDDDKGDEGNEADNDDADGNDEGDEGDDGDDADGDDDKQDVASLKAALAEERKGRRDERKLRRKLEREARAKKETDESDSNNKDIEKERSRAKASEEKTAKLAARLLKKERDDAILEEARKQGFIDPTDALTDDIRNSVEVDQDEEDPSDIDVDFDSVKDAVTSFAKKKKHLLGKPNEGDASGTRFRKGSQKSTEENDAAVLQDRYPSLR